MKRLITILPVVALGLAITTSADARDKTGRKHGNEILTTYDTNANGKIDGAEVDALKKDFDAGKASVKALDTNGDGKLSDDEIAAAGARQKRKKNK